MSRTIRETPRSSREDRRRPETARTAVRAGLQETAERRCVCGDWDCDYAAPRVPGFYSEVENA